MPESIRKKVKPPFAVAVFIGLTGDVPSVKWVLRDAQGRIIQSLADSDEYRQIDYPEYGELDL